MNGYELHGHLSEQLFRTIGNYFANFSRSVGSISEEIYSQQAVYLSYTFGISEQLKHGISGLFRSHPPLDDRIRALRMG
jgi:Zn-dependent protease with chaperone function